MNMNMNDIKMNLTMTLRMKVNTMMQDEAEDKQIYDT